MRLGCCADLERLADVDASGYDYVEPPVRALVPAEPDDRFEQVRARFDRASVRPEAFNVFIPADLPVVGPTVDAAGLARHVDAAFGRCRRLGAGIVVFGSGGARNIPDGWSRTRAMDQTVAFLHDLADRALSANLKVVIEPLTREVCNFINSVPEAVEIAREVSREEIGVLADLYHMETDGQPLADLDVPGPDLLHAHLPVPAIPETAAGLSPFAHRDFLAGLKRIGYDGRISVEDNGRRFADFAREAGAVLDHLRALWDSA